MKAEIAILTKNIDSLSKGKSEKGLVAESFDWDEESVSFEDEGVTKVKAFMAIVEEEPSVGKNDARSGQWVEITMKKVQRLLSMTDGDERKHVLDYTHIDLDYVEDQRKNLISKFNSLNQELSSCKSELTDLKNTKALNCSLQNEITRLNLENESQRDEISDLKKVIEKWTSSKAVESPSETAPEITSDFEFECDIQEPMPHLPKLLGVEPNDSSKDDISLADLTLTPTVLKSKSRHIQTPLQLSLNQEVLNLPKANKEPGLDLVNIVAVVKKTLAKLKAQSSQGSFFRKPPMIPKPFIDCKYCGFNDHHSDECEYYPGCDICGSIAYETSDCTKKPSSNNRKPRIANKRSTKPTEKYSKELGPKVVFGDNSSVDTEGYGSVNCNGFT
ncbi:hypothetical protein Tco_1455357, partial [Tanacetum coccineum]